MTLDGFVRIHLEEKLSAIFLPVTAAQKPESFTDNVNFEGKFALENKRYEIGWRLDQI